MENNNLNIQEELIKELIKEIKELKSLLVYYKSEEKNKLETLKKEYNSLINKEEFKTIKLKFCDKEVNNNGNQE